MSKSLVNAFLNTNKLPKQKEITDYEMFPDKDLLETLRTKIMGKLIAKSSIKEENLSDFIDNIIDEAIQGYDLTNLQRNHLYHVIENEMKGYGPLTELLEDENITEIMVNSPDEIYIEIDGKLKKDESVSFINNDHIIRTMNKLIAQTGKAIDLSYPMIDARLDDGSRIYGILPPLSLHGPIINIHKFQKETSTIDDFIRLGSITPYMATFLASAVKGKCNILISGSSGSGGTTLLASLSDFIGDDERIITIEDMPELRIKKEHVVALETKISSMATLQITMKDLLKNAVRMRPDRIIVGELIGEEAFDLLQIMNSGHDGAMTTIHANGIKDAISRLETLVLLNGYSIPLKVIREYIVSAIDLIVNIERLSDGKRKVTSICELEIVNGEIIPNEIFAFHQKGITKNNEVSGEYILYDKKVPKIIKKLNQLGIYDVDFMFSKKKK